MFYLVCTNEIRTGTVLFSPLGRVQSKAYYHARFHDLTLANLRLLTQSIPQPMPAGQPSGAHISFEFTIH